MAYIALAVWISGSEYAGQYSSRKIIAAVVARELTTFVNTAVLFGCSFTSTRECSIFYSTTGYQRELLLVLLIENLYIFLWAKLLNGLLV